MSADPCIKPHGARIASLAESIYFGPDGARLFGWLHRPSVGTGTDMGLVICPPFGYEAICSHRAARSLAEAAAELGIPALRFDYLGTGDSAEIEPEADQVDIWSQDVLTAITAMQKHSGVSRICLVGFRLGALLAVQAANRCKAVEGLILIAPVISGRRYLRELRTTRLAGLLRSAPADSLESAAPDDANSVQGRPLEISGFSLSAATLSTLEKIDLTRIGLPLGCDALVIDGTSFPVARNWVEEQSKLGRQIQYLSLPKVVELMITAPQYALASPPMVTSFTEWLALHLRKPARAERDDLPATASRPAPSNGALVLPTDSDSPNATLTERPVFFGLEARLFGIVTEPEKGEKRRRAVILLNAGADHHVGPSRVHVSIARRWARRGYYVLRMDLGGLGDSGTRPGSHDDDVFPPAALDDIRAGIEFLKASYNIRDIALAGLCSGAYHALRAAAAGMPVTRVLLVNPQNFFWKKGASLADLQIAEVVQNPAVYRHRISSGTAWRRLLSGQVNIWRIVRIYVWRSLLPLHSMLRTVARRLGVRLPYDLVRELEEIAARGVRVVFVFADGEPGLELLKVEVGASIKRLGPRCGLHIIERADHVFSHRGPRATLEDVLSEELFVRSGFDAAQSMPTER
jgi:alpha-beta hydrolase superfamily lysophospholipase